MESQLMNKDQVLEKLAEFEGLESKPVKKFSASAGVLVVDDRPVMGENIIESAAYSVGIPRKFITLCDADIQATLLNHFLAKNGAPTVAMKKDQVVGFSFENAPIIAPERVVNKIQELTNAIGYDRVSKYNGLVDIFAVGEKEDSVSVGDIVKGGVMLTFSPLGIAMPEVTAYTLRLACINGMLTQESVARFRRTNEVDGNLDDWFKYTIPEAYQTALNQVQKYREMKEIKLGEDLPAIVRHVTGDLPVAVRNTVYEQALKDRPATLYDLLNTITYVASHRMENINHMKSLMSIGGEMSGHYSTCPTCHNILN
jgi:hypothetical protein